MSQEQTPFDPAPHTGLPAVDEALARLADLDERPVGEHHDELAAAHEALHAALQSPTETNALLPPGQADD